MSVHAGLSVRGGLAAQLFPDTGIYGSTSTGTVVHVDTLKHVSTSLVVVARWLLMIGTKAGNGRIASRVFAQ